MELLLPEGLGGLPVSQTGRPSSPESSPLLFKYTRRTAILRRVRRLLAQLAESGAAFKDVFRNPALRRMQLAWAASILGTWAYGIAVVVYAYDQGGATAVGIVGLARWLSAAFVSPFAALLGDRYDRRLVMVASDLARAALIGAAAVAVIVDAPPIVVYVLASLVGIAATAFRPAQAALTPTLARTPDELTAANVVASTIESVGIFGGPAIGGILLAATGTATVFVATAGALLWSAVLIVAVRPAVEAPEVVREPGSVRDELLAGFRTIGRDRRLRLLVGLFSAQTFVDGMLNVLIVVLALEYLDAGKAAVGFLNSAVGIGGLLGAVVAAALVGRKKLAGDFGLGIFIWGVPIALAAVWPNEIFVLLLLGVVGIGNTIVDVSGMTLLQRSAPDDVLARVFGVLESILLLTIGLGALVAPLLLDWLGTRGALIAVGALLPVLVVPSWPMLTAIDRAARIPAVQLEALLANQIFAPLPPSTLEQLADALDEVSVGAGDVVVEQGAAGDRFYLIRDGELEVIVDGKPTQWLGPRDSFGEIALLRDVPRTATVRAKSDARLYALDRNEFLAAVTGFGPSLSAAESVIGMRLGPARAGLVRA
jgi:MFS family permease